MSRSIPVFLRDLAAKPPLVFPYIALFHLLMTIFTLGGIFTDPGLPVTWTEIGWMLAYTMLWLLCCDLRRWAAIGYILVTVANVVLYYGLREWSLYASTLMLPSILFGFLLLFYFPRFR